MLYFRRSNRLLTEESLVEMDRRKRVGTLMNYYAELFNNPEALEEYRAESRANVAARKEADRHLQSPAELTRQQITFRNCIFSDNSYGYKTQSATWGVIKAETDTNDLYIHDSIFRDNAFADSETTVSLG